MTLKDAYQKGQQKNKKINAGEQTTIDISIKAQQRWYDLSFGIVEEPSFIRQFAGRQENGKPSISDPLMR